MTFSPAWAARRGDLVEAEIGRIGPDAIGDFREVGEVFRDLLSRHLRRRSQRGLVAAERRHTRCTAACRWGRSAREPDERAFPASSIPPAMTPRDISRSASGAHIGDFASPGAAPPAGWRPSCLPTMH